MLIFGKYVSVGGCFIFSALFVLLLNDSLFTCMPCPSSPLVFDSLALAQLEAIETVTGTALELLWQSPGGPDRSRISSMGKAFFSPQLCASNTENVDRAGCSRWCEQNKRLCEVWGWTQTSVTLTLFRDWDAHFYFCLWEFYIRPRFLSTSGNKTHLLNYIPLARQVVTHVPQHQADRKQIRYGDFRRDTDEKNFKKR